METNSDNKDSVVGFDAVINSESKIIILGSMPSVTSLKESGYYAHPQNAFWWIISELLQENFLSKNYKHRYEIILKNNIALWDVIASGERKGSLDSAINLKTAQCNDFEKLFKKYPNLSIVACNGGLSHKLFQTRIHKPLKLATKLIKLPSSSAAHASMRREKKLSSWRELLDL